MNWLLKFLGFGDEGVITKLFREAVSATSGQGVSSTKIVWLSNGMLACYCATLATVGGVTVYVFLQKVDAVYCGFCTALWTISLGFAGSVKRSQNQITKEITLANQPPAQAGTQDKGGTS